MCGQLATQDDIRLFAEIRPRKRFDFQHVASYVPRASRLSPLTPKKSGNFHVRHFCFFSSKIKYQMPDDQSEPLQTCMLNDFLTFFSNSQRCHLQTLIQAATFARSYPFLDRTDREWTVLIKRFDQTALPQKWFGSNVDRVGSVQPALASGNFRRSKADRQLSIGLAGQSRSSFQFIILYSWSA